MRYGLEQKYIALMRQRCEGGWTDGWFLYNLDQQMPLTDAEKDSICKALGYRSGWTVNTEYILYQQWQKDRIVEQLIDCGDVLDQLIQDVKSSPLGTLNLFLCLINHVQPTQY